MIQIEFLPAFNGDCIHIMIDNEKHILIDGGLARTYVKTLQNKLQEVKQASKNLDLVVITHIDNDHLVGIQKLFGDNKYKSLVKKVWFNTGSTLNNYFDIKCESTKIDTAPTNNRAENEIGFKGAIKLEDVLDELNIINRVPIKAMDVIYLDDIYFKILSPDTDRLYKLTKGWNRVVKELERRAEEEVAGHSNDYDRTIEELVKNDFKKDTSISNGSSIAFLMQYQNFKFLFLADTFTEVIIQSLKKFRYTKDRPLKVDFVKLSHHGSKKNINKELLELIDTDTYIISTNGNRHNHPNQEALSRIIMFNKNKGIRSKFIFNYQKKGNLENMFQLYEFKKSTNERYSIYYNKEYQFYLYFPLNARDGAVLNYDL